MTEATFYSLWKPLLQHAIVCGIDKDSAQDLVMESIYTVIDRFNPERGEILPFGYRVLGNRIKNYFRDNKKIIPITNEIMDKMPSPHDYTVQKDEEAHALTILSVLKGQLDSSEIQLLNILQTQLENEGKYNVSVAARIIHIEPLKAHDILRKIKRKLSGIQSMTIYAEKLADYGERQAQKDEKKDTLFSIQVDSEDENDIPQFALKTPRTDEFEFFSLLAETVGINVYERIFNYMKNIQA